MKRFFSLLLVLLVVSPSVLKAETYSDITFNHEERYSQLLIDSRLCDFYANTTKSGFDRYDESGNKIASCLGTQKFDYVPGLVAKGILEAVTFYSDSLFARPWFYSIEAYANRFSESVPTTGGSLDNLNAAKIYAALSRLAGEGGAMHSIAATQTYSNAQAAMQRAAKGLADTNKNYVITPAASADAAGGWWHKSSYRNQMWLDGQYMGPALLAELGCYGYHIADVEADWKTIALQFDITWSRLWRADDKLLRHAFSATPTDSYASSWADPETGASAEYWGRACGWYFLALVDVLDLMPEGVELRPVQPVLSSYPSDCRKRLAEYLSLMAEGLLERQDAQTGCWYQLLAHDATFTASSYKGKTYSPVSNYLESSCSALFAAAYLKALRLGLLDEKAFGRAAEKAYRGVVEQFVKQRSDGTYTIIDCCASAGLGGSNGRDGSAAYYLLGSDVKRVTSYTEGKCFGAFIMAAVEYERRKAAQQSGSSALEHIDCSEEAAAEYDLLGRCADAADRPGLRVRNGRLVFVGR